MQDGRLRDLLIWDDGTDKYERELIDKVSEYGRVIIFGAGIGGRKTLELLNKHGMGELVVGFSDNDGEKINREYLGLPVFPPSELFGINCLILISSTAFQMIARQLQEIGISKEWLFYFQPAGMSLQPSEDIKFIRDNIEKFEYAYNLLEDEKSKNIFLYLVNYRITKDMIWLEHMEDLVDAEESQYFDEKILQDYDFEDGFVDAGAYIGDTLEQFYLHYPAWQGVYYCIEASNVMLPKLRQVIADINGKKICIFPYALWDGEGEIYFDTSLSSGAGSRISDKGELVKCDSLDHLIGEKKVSFLKMDIEGAEKRALLGAKGLIERDRPIMAVCIYHRKEDFFDIPLIIEQIIKEEYTYYIRQYRYGQSETVLYAMPKSRQRKG